MLDGARSGLDTIAGAAPYLVVTLGLAIAGLARGPVDGPRPAVGRHAGGGVPRGPAADGQGRWRGQRGAAGGRAGRSCHAHPGGRGRGSPRRRPRRLRRGAGVVAGGRDAVGGRSVRAAQPRRPRRVRARSGRLAAGRGAQRLHRRPRRRRAAPSQPFLAPRDCDEHAAGPHHGATSTWPTCRGTTWRPRSAWMASAPASERELGSVPGWQLAVVRRAGAAALDRARLADRPPRARSLACSPPRSAGSPPACCRRSRARPGDAIWPDEACTQRCA